MGKNKDHQTELSCAFYRMNYLYQAAVTASKIVPGTTLGNYYGRLMKEVSKKVVEKVHPEIKRTLCSCCAYPLFTRSTNADVKIKIHRRTKKRKIKHITCEPSNKSCYRKTQNNIYYPRMYSASQKKKKNIKPNKLIWNCNKCGFSKTFLQRPSHYLWIDKCEEIPISISS